MEPHNETPLSFLIKPATIALVSIFTNMASTFTWTNGGLIFSHLYKELGTEVWWDWEIFEKFLANVYASLIVSVGGCKGLVFKNVFISTFPYFKAKKGEDHIPSNISHKLSTPQVSCNYSPICVHVQKV